MARDEAYWEAEKRIAEVIRTGETDIDLSDMGLSELPESIGGLSQLHVLDLSRNRLTELPESLGSLAQLQELDLGINRLTALPDSVGNLTRLRELKLSRNSLTTLPESLGSLSQLQALALNLNEFTTLPRSLGNLPQLQDLELGRNRLTALSKHLRNLTRLEVLWLYGNELIVLPEWLGELTRLTSLYLWNTCLAQLPYSIGQLERLGTLRISGSKLTDLPTSLAQLGSIQDIDLSDNPLNPELRAAYDEGIDSVKAYLRAKAGDQVILNEAKLILVGEGEVGKSCLMDALQGKPFEDHMSTHGIEICPCKVTDHDTQTEITLNGWDFGGQPVYRPTHQLFFSSPAVYLVVWKPREGPQQGFVKEWITLIKHREPEAKILVVATHGGPKDRQPDIDRQELWDTFGKDTLTDFFHVDSYQDDNTLRRGIEDLKCAIASVAAGLSEMGRSVPKSWQDVRAALVETGEAYLSLDDVLLICRDHKLDDNEARLFITISHRLGHLIHYENDPQLRDIVVLKPDWLATAISFVLDDRETREASGLVSLTRLNHLWNDSSRDEEFRYPSEVHGVFVSLMERYDLSYCVAGLPTKRQTDETYLIAQLVPDTRPVESLAEEWPTDTSGADIQASQICRIVDDRGQSATAEGLFYQLIVRLHKYSLGRARFNDSTHWQRGLVLDGDYNGRALLEHIGNDVRIAVRAPYPDCFLGMLTNEVKYLVESFWEGLRCDVMVPCIEPCGKDDPGTGLFEVEKLIAFKRQGMDLFPCMVSGCDQPQNIDALLINAPAAQSVTIEELFKSEILDQLRGIRGQLIGQEAKIMGRFDGLDAGQKKILSKTESTYHNLLRALTDEAKEGPRLFSFEPVDRSSFNPTKWISEKFRLTLWCEHSRLPLPNLNDKGSTKGVYEIELTREWFKKAGPYLKLLTSTLSLVLPVASAAAKLGMEEAAFSAMEDQLDFGNKVIDATIGVREKIGEFMGPGDSTTVERGDAIRAQGGNLRELHALLKAKDPGFGGLVRVMNKRDEFLWVHEQFRSEY